MILQIITSVLIVISIAILFGLTPEQITNDLMSLMRPNDSMRDKARNIRGNKKKHRLYRILVNIKGALESTGKSRQFALVMCASVVLFALGIIAAILIRGRLCADPFLLYHKHPFLLREADERGA